MMGEPTQVVAPSLTPDGYDYDNCLLYACIVVAPSLTPDGYDAAPIPSTHALVVAPSLTPDGYDFAAADALRDRS